MNRKARKERKVFCFFLAIFAHFAVNMIELVRTKVV